MDPEQSDFLNEYVTYVESVIKPMRALIDERLREWRGDGRWRSYRPLPDAADPNPIQRIRTRIKRPESVVDKIRRLEDKFSAKLAAESLRSMRDVLGARIITYFPTHLAMIDREIRSQRDFIIPSDLQPRCYLPAERLARVGLKEHGFELKGKKPSGYSSIHYYLKLRDSRGLPENPVFELQVRTMLDETWGEIEHQLGYKPETMTDFSVRRQFSVISDHLEAVDAHFDFLYDQLTYQQSRSDPTEDSVLNAENFPQVLRKIGFECEQREIGKMLDILDLNGIKLMKQLTSRARLDIVDSLRRAYKQERDGKALPTFDLIATLADTTTRTSAEQAARMLITKLRFVDVKLALNEDDDLPQSSSAA